MGASRVLIGISNKRREPLEEVKKRRLILIKCMLAKDIMVGRIHWNYDSLSGNHCYREEET